MKILVIDVGGSHVKMHLDGREPLRIDSGPGLTARRMISGVLAATAGWRYDAVSIGIPMPVIGGRPTREPVNLGGGWTRADYSGAFGKPVRLINDAAMQALGSYQGGRMLFLGLGTGLGTAAIFDEAVVPMEMGHLPYRKGLTFEDYAGAKGLAERGRRAWERHVHRIVELLRQALLADYVVLGGGNVKKLRALPRHATRGDNANAFIGGERLWSRKRAVLP
jgi:polyphosphate glucokinase